MELLRDINRRLYRMEQILMRLMLVNTCASVIIVMLLFLIFGKRGTL